MRRKYDTHLFITATSLRTVKHVLPNFFPLLAPSERFAADLAYFGG